MCAEPSAGRRIFISYKRNVKPDEPVALEILRALSQQHEVFIDQTMFVGERWAERIEAELRRTDFLIVLLSSESVHSEMVQAEIETAHHLAKQQGGRPTILPVRLACTEPFQYPLSAYLNPINWAWWEKPEDTSRLLDELRVAISGGELATNDLAKALLMQRSEPPSLPSPHPAAQLEMPEGAMDPQSRFYVERPGDAVALEAIQHQGVTISIKAPRQMGKSSLLMHTLDAAVQNGKKIALLDFQLFDKTTLIHADTFFRQFCVWLTDELDIDDQTEIFWNNPLGNVHRCTRYVSRYLLKEVGGPVVLAMDEVEGILDTDFCSDFFGMLRNWHNSRRIGNVWKQLDLVLVTSTEPYQLIADLKQSPFNVGEVIELTDFTAEQVTDLNHRHGAPLTPQQEHELIALIGGHPYLVRKALYSVKSGRLSAVDLLRNAIEDHSPFWDHLRYHLFRLRNNSTLIQGLLQILRLNTCSDEEVYFRLHSAGLVQREGRTIKPRYRLYEAFFKEHLHG